MVKHSPHEWFKIWEDLIVEYKSITRATLAECSGASLWILKGLHKDFLDYSMKISYVKGKFVANKIQANKLSLTLSEDEANKVR